MDCVKPKPIRQERHTTMYTPSQVLAIRVATDADAADIARLAALDQRRLPQGKVLLGVIDGHTRVAVGIADGSVVADPFHPTADVVALLKLRAERLRDAGRAGAAAHAERVRSLLPRRRRLTSTA